MFDSRTDSGHAGVAARLAGGQRLAFLGLALDVYAPALGLETLLTLTSNVALVAIKITTGIGVIQDLFQGQGVVLRGGADLDLATQLLAPVGADRDLVAEVGFAVFLGPGGLGVLLPALGRFPAHGHRPLLDQWTFFLRDVLSRNGNQTGIHHLPTTGDITVLGELTMHRLKQRVPRLCHRQSLAEGPKRRAVWYLAAAPQAQETLEAQSIQHLVFHLFVTQSISILKCPGAYHQCRGKRRTPTALPPRSRRNPVHLRRQRLEIHMLLHHSQHISQTVQFRFPFLSGKQAFFDHQRCGLLAEINNPIFS